MDSLTQIALGATVAAAVVPAAHRRAALLAGAALGTLPDLDSLPIALLSDDPIALMTLHRGASHSLLVLPWLGWALWASLRRRGGRVSAAPWPWFWAIQLALVTHPLLDALTVYGTQLFWPLPMSPVMGASLFIIDPLYSLPLLLGVGVAAWSGVRPLARRALLAGLLLSTLYIGWSLLAKVLVDRAVLASLPAELQAAPRFSVPTPLNTLLWRVVIMTPEGHWEGERSLVADRGPICFDRHAWDTGALAQAAHLPAVRRLAWFNRGFMRADVEGGELRLSDLRMGAEPDYAFRFIVATWRGDDWQPLKPAVQLPWSVQAQGQLGPLWQRIWQAPASSCADGDL